MAERDPLASLLGTVLAAVVTFALVAPLIRRKQRRQTEEIAGRVGKAGFTPLMYAATVGDKDTLTAILATGVNVNDADDNGDSALMHAVRSDQSEIAEILLGVGADPNQMSMERLTPLHVAQHRGSKMYEMLKSTPIGES